MPKPQALSFSLILAASFLSATPVLAGPWATGEVSVCAGSLPAGDAGARVACRSEAREARVSLVSPYARALGVGEVRVLQPDENLVGWVLRWPGFFRLE